MEDQRCRCLDASVYAFMVSVAACAHGVNDLKHWLFYSNHPWILPIASVCSHAVGTRLYQASKRSADGTFLTRLTALCPDSLAAAIADLFHTGLTSGNQESPFPIGACCCLSVFPSALSRVGLRMAAALPTGLFRVKLIFWVASGTFVSASHRPVASNSAAPRQC